MQYLCPIYCTNIPAFVKTNTKSVLLARVTQVSTSSHQGPRMECFWIDEALANKAFLFL